MDEPLHLALDQGGSKSRALVFDLRGEVLAHAAVEVATAQPGPGCVEQDGEELVRSLRRAIKGVVKRLGARARRIASAGLATQRSSCLAFDRGSGAPLSRVLSWQDTRAAARLEPLAENEAQVRARTGLRLS